MSVAPSCDDRSVLHRTCRIRLRVTRAQARRCYGLLRAGGDVWAALIEVNRARFSAGARPIANYQEWCREIAGVQVGELSVTAMRSVVRRYSDAFFEAAKRRRAGERARYPRRKRALFSLRWYQGTFAIDGARVRLGTARGSAPLWVRLSRELPYPLEQLRSVTLLADAGRLWLDVTAAVPVESHDLDPEVVAGVDLGIIHPYAVASGAAALLVSGRQIRAEERLHLADTKARAKRMSPKVPRRGQRGSRRWRTLRAHQRRAEAKHRGRVRLAHHQGAKEVVTWAIAQRVGTLVVGDPIGITRRDTGKRQNLRLRQWRRTHLLRCLIDKAEVAGIRVVRVDERGTSSTCPECKTRVPKPKGRAFSCPHCSHRGHRDLIAARNIAGRSGGSTSSPLFVQHRRAGIPPARRDRRRHLMDAHRSCPAPGRLRSRGSRSLVNVTRAPARRSVHVDPLDSRRGSNDLPNRAKVA
jgi:IS605 OrfB family transposase